MIFQANNIYIENTSSVKMIGDLLNTLKTLRAFKDKNVKRIEVNFLIAILDYSFRTNRDHVFTVKDGKLEIEGLFANELKEFEIVKLNLNKRDQKVDLIEFGNLYGVKSLLRKMSDFFTFEYSSNENEVVVKYNDLLDKYIQFVNEHVSHDQKQNLNADKIYYSLGGKI